MGENRRTTIWILALWGVFLFTSGQTASVGASKNNLFDGLQQRLIGDGYDRGAITELFTRPGVAFDVDSVALFFVHNEAKLDYGQFSRSDAIARARAYMKNHATTLDTAQSRYGVDKEVITAILLVETQLGKYVGRSVVINTLATMASLTDPRIRDTLYREIPTKKRMSRREFENKAKAKSDWAYRELKALIEFTHDQQLDIVAIKGSYAGAMGLSQFMPSNALKLGVDGNQNGQINLFDDADAIFSIAKYFKYHGWKEGIDPKKAHRVIRHYNNSSYYADAVLTVTDKLRNP